VFENRTEEGLLKLNRIELSEKNFFAQGTSSVAPGTFSDFHWLQIGRETCCLDHTFAQMESLGS